MQKQAGTGNSVKLVNLINKQKQTYAIVAANINSQGVFTRRKKPKHVRGSQYYVELTEV